MRQQNHKHETINTKQQKTMLAFLLAKPTQFDAPFFRWMHAHKPGLPFMVYYWQPVGSAADTDTETGASLTWGIDLLGGYNRRQVNQEDAAGFAAMLQQDGIRYLVCNGWKSGFSPLVKAARQAGVTLGLRIDSVVWGKTAIELTVRRLYLKLAYSPFRHFFSSGTVGDEYLGAIGVPPEKWKRWPYCVDVDFFRRTPACLQDATYLDQKFGLDRRPLVLGVCKWVDRENPVELLEAFIKLNNPGLQLVMIGDGPLRPQLESLQKANPHLRVFFPGYVSYRQLPAWYALAKVFVHPARHEPWGVSVQEAIASGCTVVASSRVGSACDLIRHGGNGYQYPSGDVNALSHFLEQALQLSPEKAKETNDAILKFWSFAAVSKAFEGLTG